MGDPGAVQPGRVATLYGRGDGPSLAGPQGDSLGHQGPSHQLGPTGSTRLTHSPEPITGSSPFPADHFRRALAATCAKSDIAEATWEGPMGGAGPRDLNRPHSALIRRPAAVCRPALC